MSDTEDLLAQYELLHCTVWFLYETQNAKLKLHKARMLCNKDTVLWCDVLETGPRKDTVLALSQYQILDLQFMANQTCASSISHSLELQMWSCECASSTDKDINSFCKFDTSFVFFFLGLFSYVCVFFV